MPYVSRLGGQAWLRYFLIDHIVISKIPIQHSWIKTTLDFFGSPGVLF